MTFEAANDNQPEFQSFGKISRLRRGCVITEKLDGTNAQVYVGENGEVRAGSRNRWITPESDNYGFAAWVRDHAAELAKLGPGRHYGEWYGKGINRGYGLNERRFALFNVGRWETRPACCDLVPVLFTGQFATDTVDEVVSDLATNGSSAVPGFMDPEGVIVFMTASHHLYKVLIKNDDIPKSLSEAA